MRSDSSNLEEEKSHSNVKGVFVIDFDGPLMPLMGEEISDAPLKKMVFETLAENNYMCVLGSQRIMYNDVAKEKVEAEEKVAREQHAELDKEALRENTSLERKKEIRQLQTKIATDFQNLLTETTFLNQMKKKLDEAFGPDRAFLTIPHMTSMGKNLQEKTLAQGLSSDQMKESSGAAKSPILDSVCAIKECKEIKKENVYLVDDRMTYKKDIEDNGYKFIHTTDGNSPNPNADRKYLAEMLIHTIKDPQKIYQNIKNSELDDNTKKEFIGVVKQCYQEKQFKLSIPKKFDALAPDKQKSIEKLIEKCTEKHTALMAEVMKSKNPDKLEKAAHLHTIVTTLEQFKRGEIGLGRAQDIISENSKMLDAPTKGMFHPTRNLAKQADSIMTHLLNETVEPPQLKASKMDTLVMHVRKLST